MTEGGGRSAGQHPRRPSDHASDSRDAGDERAGTNGCRRVGADVGGRQTSVVRTWSRHTPSASASRRLSTPGECPGEPVRPQASWVDLRPASLYITRIIGETTSLIAFVCVLPATYPACLSDAVRGGGGRTGLRIARTTPTPDTINAAGRTTPMISQNHPGGDGTSSPGPAVSAGMNDSTRSAGTYTTVTTSQNSVACRAHLNASESRRFREVNQMRAGAMGNGPLRSTPPQAAAAMYRSLSSSAACRTRASLSEGSGYDGVPLPSSSERRAAWWAAVRSSSSSSSSSGLTSMCT